MKVRPSSLVTLPALAIALALAALAPRPANAESAPNPCAVSERVSPGLDGTIPANAAGVLFRLPQIVPMRQIEDFAIELRGPDQGLISTTAVALEQGWYLIKPGAGLPQGNHTLSYVALCNGEVPRTRTEHRFKVGPAVAWPTALGATRVGASVGGWQGICGGYRAWAPLLVEGSTELLAHAFATRFDVTFKGTSKRSEYGIALQMPTGPFELPLELMCSAAQPRISGTVTITAHVEGAPSDPPPVTLAVEIDCPHLAEPGACGTVGPDGGSGTVGPDGGNPSPVDGGAPVPPRMDGGSSPDVQPLGPTDAGPGRSDAPATTPPPPSGGGSGCQMAPGAATAWWLAVLLAAPWLRRRYRSRSG